MKKKSSKLLSLMLVLTIFLTACAGGGNSSTSSSKKDIVIVKNTDLLSMDSAKATDGMSFEIISAVQEGLYTIAADGTEKEAMVSSVKVSDDELTYTFTLKDNKWSNGDPVVAGDFVYAWRKLVDPNTSSEYAFIADIAGILNASDIMSGSKKPEELGVKAIDDKTLEVKLYKKVPFLKKVLAFGSFLPQNEKFAKQQGDQYALKPENQVYNGPFKMTEWLPGNSFKVVKNDQYYDKDKVKLDSITWKVAKDYQTAALEFDTGAADYVKLSGELVSKYTGKPELKMDPGSYVWFLVSNPNVPELKNSNFKLALANAINRDELTNSILKDGSTSAYGFVASKLAYSESGKDFREDNGNNFFNEGPEKAKEYAKKAFEELGVKEIKLELLFEDSEESKKVAEYLQADLEEDIPGLKIVLKSQPKKSRLQLQKDGNFQVALHRWGPDYPDPMTFLDMYLSTSSYNYDKYNNAEYDKLIKLAASGTQSASERWETLKKAEKILLEKGEGPIPVYQTGVASLWNTKLKGVVYSLTGASYYYKEAYIEE